MRFFRCVFRFYADGFRSMTIGKSLWMIILIKLFIIFVIFRLFFFHDFLGDRFKGEDEKADYVAKELIQKLP